jgi:hypothetical protein
MWNWEEHVVIDSLTLSLRTETVYTHILRMLDTTARDRSHIIAHLRWKYTNFSLMWTWEENVIDSFDVDVKDDRTVYTNILCILDTTSRDRPHIIAHLRWKYTNFSLMWTWEENVIHSFDVGVKDDRTVYTQSTTAAKT